MLALTLFLLGFTPSRSRPPLAPADEPPIKVWLNQDGQFQRGDKARVNVKLAEDGYLMVLRASGVGQVRVLFPLDPGDDNFVRGGETIEVRGRGDREAFSIDEREGLGVVLAARSAIPFRFDEFVRGDHWDYRVLDAQRAGADKEATLLEIVQRMAPDEHFDYDAQQYVIAPPGAQAPIGVHFGFGWGWGWPDYGYCDPFWQPFLCPGMAYYGPFFYGPYIYRPYIYRPYTYWPFVYWPYVYGSYGYRWPRDLFINRARPGRLGTPLRGGTPATRQPLRPRSRPAAPPAKPRERSAPSPPPR